MAHEMNGDWFEWGVTNHDNSPYLFKKAWKHVVVLFRKVGATNVKFLWSPYPRPAKSLPKLYPGNAYVDYVGVTNLNWGKDRWKSMPKLLSGPMTLLRKTTQTHRRPQGKPVILPELASNHIGGNKASWIRNGYEAAYKKWPTLRAIVYFDYDTTFAGQPDWRLLKPADRIAVRAYRAVATKSRFKAAFR